MRFAAHLCLLALCAPLAGCVRNLDERDVREFVDAADQAARRRFAPGICELRGKGFTLHTKFQAAKSHAPPGQMQIDRHMFCVEAGRFSRVRQYKLERRSLDIRLGPDRKTARVIADYVETRPYYEEGIIPATPDDFYQFQVLEVRDESIVGIEGGDVVFLSTDSEIHQSLVPKSSVDLPYD